MDNLSKEERRKFDRGVISSNKHHSSPEFLDIDKLKSAINKKGLPKTGIDMFFAQSEEQEKNRKERIKNQNSK